MLAWLGLNAPARTRVSTRLNGVKYATRYGKHLMNVRTNFKHAVSVLAITATALLVVLYAGAINSYFATPTASNYLLVLLIVADVVVPFFVRWLDQRESASREKVLYLKEKVFETWYPEGTLGKVNYSNGRIEYEPPSDPVGLTSLPPRAKEDFDGKYAPLLKSWEETKAECRKEEEELRSIYGEFHYRIVAEVAKKSGILRLPEYDNRGDMANTKWRQFWSLCTYAFSSMNDIRRGLSSQRISLQEVSQPKELWTITMGQYTVAHASKIEVEALKDRMEEFQRDGEASLLLKQIIQMKERTDYNRARRAAEFKQKVDGIVREIEWEYKLRVKPATLVTVS